MGKMKKKQGHQWNLSGTQGDGLEGWGRVDGVEGPCGLKMQGRHFGHARDEEENESRSA